MSMDAMGWALRQNMTWAQKGVLAGVCSFHDPELQTCRATANELIARFDWEYVFITRKMKELQDLRVISLVKRAKGGAKVFCCDHWDGRRMREKEKLRRIDPLNLFNQFWKAYPRSDGKQAALDSWIKGCIDDEEFVVIMEDVEARAKYHPQWKDPQYVPYASKYLNQAMWEDEWFAAYKRAQTRTPDDVSGYL